MLKKILSLGLVLAIVGCASGGGSAGVSAPATPPSSGGSTAPTQPYQTIEPVTYNYSLIHGDTDVTYRSGTYKNESQFTRTDKYKIADYGFFEILINGTHDGSSRNSSETADAGPWTYEGKIHRADLNGDGHEDFFVEDFWQGDRADRPQAFLHAFINDGNGHFVYSPDLFTGSTCINYGDLDVKTDPNHECGFTTAIQRSIVADFNGDGIDDFFITGNYFLSDDGKLSKQNDKLPSWMMEVRDVEEGWTGSYTHDNYAGDIDGDGDLDIVGHYMTAGNMGWKGLGVLINDGTGGFTTNWNFPTWGDPVSVGLEAGQKLWNTTAAIGDFNNDGSGDVAVGWFNPSSAQAYGFAETYENSAGAVFWNNGNNDWRDRWSELPSNYFGANGNANDIEVIDFNGDGLLDIVLASTQHDPYYKGRVVQFFQNNGNETFSDVTSSVSPDHARFVDGNANGYWQGEGELHILDFDHDGDLDIVDSVNGTYALVNNNGQFDVYNDWPTAGNCGGCRLYPVEIDGVYQYDFIGYTNDTGSTSNTSTFFQVLDPPFVQMMNDITTKPQGYAKTVFSSKMLLDGVRDATRGSNIMYNYTEGSSILGYSDDINDEYGFFIAQLDGTSTGGVVGFDFDHDNLHTGVYYVDNTLEAFNDTIWYGTGTADVDYNSINTFTEFAFAKDNFVYTLGAGFAYTTVQSFTERDSPVNVKVNSFTMLDMTVFADAKYVTQSKFGTTAFGVGLDHYQSISTTDINFADVLKYEFKDRLTVGSVDFVHSYGPVYLRASANTESINSYELGFILNF